MWEIDKRIDFCYGHRVHNQQLDPTYSVDACHVCRHLHGHQGELKVHLASNELANSMVTDFKHLNSFKKFVDNALDHRFIIDRNDPMINYIIPGWSELPTNPILDTIDLQNNAFEVDVQKAYEWGYADSQDMHDLLESFVIVNFVPTSENLTAWLCKVANYHLDGLEGVGDRIQVSAVEFWETPKSHVRYTPDTVIHHS